MRWCSRCAPARDRAARSAGRRRRWSDACGSGSGRRPDAAGQQERERNGQPAPAPGRTPALRDSPVSSSRAHGAYVQSVSSARTRSARGAGLDRGPLRSSTQPRTRTRRFAALRVAARPPENALMSFQDRDRERLRPAAAEIHIDRAPALADRQHLALDHRETTPLGQKLRPALGRLNDIIRIGPEAKLGVLGRHVRAPSVRQRRPGSRHGRRPRPGPGQSNPPAPTARFHPRHRRISRHAAIAIGRGFGLLEESSPEARSGARA